MLGNLDDGVPLRIQVLFVKRKLFHQCAGFGDIFRVEEKHDTVHRRVRTIG